MGKVHYSGSYKVILWLVGFFTLGIGPLAMWLSTRSWPKELDGEGMTLRNGRRVRWDELTDIRRVTVVNNMGRRITGRLDLIFGKTKVQIVPQSLEEGPAIMSYLSGVVGQELASG